ncbi:MAG: zinc ribbon domain-containing protein [Caldilineaceae bacterium]
MLTYPNSVIQSLRFQYCPMCTTPLTRKVLFDDNIPRITCPDCGWIQLVSNVVGVAVVAGDEGIVAILPPEEDGVALPAGLVEYGEDPADAAVRGAGRDRTSGEGCGLPGLALCSIRRLAGADGAILL